MMRIEKEVTLRDKTWFLYVTLLFLSSGLGVGISVIVLTVVSITVSALVVIVVILSLTGLGLAFCCKASAVGNSSLGFTGLLSLSVFNTSKPFRISSEGEIISLLGVISILFVVSSSTSSPVDATSVEDRFSSVSSRAGWSPNMISVTSSVTLLRTLSSPFSIADIFVIIIVFWSFDGKNLLGFICVLFLIREVCVFDTSLLRIAKASSSRSILGPLHKSPRHGQVIFQVLVELQNSG